MSPATLTCVTVSAIFTAQLSPHLTGGNVVVAELVCWVLLLLCSKVVPFVADGKWNDIAIAQSHALRNRPRNIAACLVLLALSSAATDTRWIVPRAIPVLMFLRLTKRIPECHIALPKTLHGRLFLVAIGVVSSIVLSYSSDLKSPMDKWPLQLLAWVATVSLFAQYIHMFEPQPDLGIYFQIQKLAPVVWAIGERAVPALMFSVAVLFMRSPDTSLDWSQVLLAGAMKALHWVCLFWIGKRVPWDIVPAIWTAAFTSTARSDAYGGSQETLHMSLLCGVTLGALYHTVRLLPRYACGRHILLFFAFSPILFRTHSTLEFRYEAALPFPENISSHPIEQLITQAAHDYTQMIAHQSQTLSQSKTEYHRRYNRTAPPGFEKWYHYAKEKNSAIIDDYDMINDMLAPLWSIDPEGLREMTNHVTGPNGAPAEMHKVGFKGGVFEDSGVNSSTVNGIRELLSEVVAYIPDMDFVLSELDEPSVIVSAKAVENHGSFWTPEFIRGLEHRSIWERVSKPCREAEGLALSQAVTHKGKNTKQKRKKGEKIDDFGIPFIRNLTSAKDICTNPSFSAQHGFLRSPDTFLLTESPVPILSPAAPSTFGDILYPSRHYAHHYKEKTYNDAVDPDWEHKTDTLYWAGSTRGTAQSNSNSAWRWGHRQRFVNLTRHVDVTKYTYLQPTPAKHQSRHGKGKWTWRAVNRTYIGMQLSHSPFNVHITSIVQCDADSSSSSNSNDCEDQAFALGLVNKSPTPSSTTDSSTAYTYSSGSTGPAPRSDAWKSKLVMDIDGNTHSQDFYTSLQSRSAVLKQSLFREWHDERLVPWFHFIPVSMGMAELPEIVRWFGSADPQATKFGKLVGERGRRATGGVAEEFGNDVEGEGELGDALVRMDDMRVWTFRLMLELARVLDLQRSEKEAERERQWRREERMEVVERRRGGTWGEVMDVLRSAWSYFKGDGGNMGD